MLLADERRLPAHAPASFLAGLLGRRVLREGERRAIVRRIAATREDVKLPAHIRSSPSFAPRVLDAIDRGTVPPPLETLAQHVRTLLAFADALDIRSALTTVTLSLSKRERESSPSERDRLGRSGWSLTLRQAQGDNGHADDDLSDDDGGGDGDDCGVLRIDRALLGSEDDAFAWRRFALEAGATFEVVDLGAPDPPLDLAAVDGVIALLRYVASQRDADARRVLVAPQSGVASDDARALLTAAGDRADLFDVIAKGAVADATRFAHGLNTVTAAYKAPDASAQTTLAAIASAFPFGDERTRRTLERLARDFDAARAFAEPWEAHDLIAEIESELAAAPPRAAVISTMTPAAPVADEPAQPVAMRKLAFSASSLNAYAECERKWWFRYACAAVEDRGSSASFYGIAFHAALEDFHGVHSRFDSGDADGLSSYLDFCVVAAFDRHRTRFDAPVEFELQKRRARRTARKYLAWLLERARRAPFEVIGCETETDIELGGQRFVGYIDRLDRDDRTGTVTVVDYKTGSIATSAEDYLAEVRAFREFQLPFYYWARTAAGDVVTRLALVPLKDALLDVEPVELEVVTTSRAPRSKGTTGEIAVAELERARERMVSLAGLLASGTLAAFHATDDPDACRYCAYTRACRERPSALEERFGR